MTIPNNVISRYFTLFKKREGEKKRWRWLQWLHTIYYTEMKTGTADGWSAWLRGSRLLCGLHHHTWQFFPAQLCRCQNLLRIFGPFSTIVLRPESKLCLGDRVKCILSTRGWSSCAACFLVFWGVFFTAGTLSCKLSFVGWFCSPQLLCTLQLLLAGSLATVCWMSKWFQTAVGTCMDTWGTD